MTDQKAPRPHLHTWLFRIAIGLSITAIPHVIYVFEARLPGALSTTHVVAAAALFIFAEQRRQWQARLDGADDLTDQITTAERRVRQH